MTKKKYDLKINYELFEVFKDYFDDNPQLGYHSVSELLNSILRERAVQILNSKKSKNKKKKKSYLLFRF